MRLQVYYRFGEWTSLDKKNRYPIDSAPITKNVYLIHDSWEPDKSKRLIEGNLHMEDSAAGSAEFSVSRLHPMYSKFCNLFLDTVYLVVDGLLMWDGRPTKMDMDWNGTKKIYFEGALSYLNDSLLGTSDKSMSMTVYDFVSDYFLSGVNKGCEYINPDENKAYLLNDRHFYETASIVLDQNGTGYNWNPNYESCMDWLKSYILENFQARCKIVYPKDAVNNFLLKNKPIPRYLCVINNFEHRDIAPQLPTKYIDFGKNMLSYSYSKEINENFVTNYVGRGETKDDSSGREMKKFVLMDPNGAYVYLDAAASEACYNWPQYFSDIKMDQRQYGNLCKSIDFSSVKKSSTLWRCTREKYRIIRKSPINETITISGADIEPAAKATFPTQYTPTVTYDNGAIVPPNKNKKLLLQEDAQNSVWPKYFEYYRCNPTYFDLWTRVIAKSKPHFVGSKTWYITGIDLSFDNPLTPEITMESNAKSLTDEYIKSGAQIGDVAGAFQPSS